MNTCTSKARIIFNGCKRTGLLVNTPCRHRWSTKRPLPEGVEKYRSTMKTTYENQYGKVLSPYPDPTRYKVEDVHIVQNDDPRSVCISEKHGRSFAVVDESRKSSVALTVPGDFSLLYGLHKTFYMYFHERIDFKKLAEENHPVGSVVPVRNNKHWVYFLVIRNNWWDRGAYRPMRESLAAMREHATTHNVENIAMGRLGSYEDGLDFTHIYKDMKEIFYDTPVSLTVYLRTTRPPEEDEDDTLFPQQIIRDTPDPRA
jgi:hypothetical protein